jgi:hypothetical protein
VLGEPGLSTERHRQAADGSPPGADRIEILSRLPENRINRLHSGLPARRPPQAIAGLAALPAQPCLHPGLDLLLRGPRPLPPHALPVHPHPGIAHVEDDPELLYISRRHKPILGSIEQPAVALTS